VAFAPMLAVPVEGAGVVTAEVLAEQVEECCSLLRRASSAARLCPSPSFDFAPDGSVARGTAASVPIVKGVVGTLSDGWLAERCATCGNAGDGLSCNVRFRVRAYAVGYDEPAPTAPWYLVTEIAYDDGGDGAVDDDDARKRVRVDADEVQLQGGRGGVFSARGLRDEQLVFAVGKARRLRLADEGAVADESCCVTVSASLALSVSLMMSVTD
jgi:hypothetical protein